MTYGSISKLALMVVIAGLSVLTAVNAKAQDVCQDFDRKVRQLDVEALYKAMPDRLANGESKYATFDAYKGFAGHKGLEANGGRIPIFTAEDVDKCQFTDFGLDAVWLYFAHSPDMLSVGAPTCTLDYKGDRKQLKSIWKKYLKKNKILDVDMLDLYNGGRYLGRDNFKRIEKHCPNLNATQVSASGFECYINYAKTEILPFHATYLKNAYLEENPGDAIDMVDGITERWTDSGRFGNYVRSVHSNENALNSRNMIAVQNILGCSLDMTRAQQVDASIGVENQNKVIAAAEAEREKEEAKRKRIIWLTNHNAEERAARVGKLTTDEPKIYPGLMAYGNFHPSVCDAVDYEITKNRTTCSGACSYFRPDLKVNAGHKAWHSRWFGVKLDGAKVCDAVPQDALSRANKRRSDGVDRARREQIRRQNYVAQPSMSDFTEAWGQTLRNMSECEAKYGKCKYVED